jgi:hypothetical protein
LLLPAPAYKDKPCLDQLAHVTAHLAYGATQLSGDGVLADKGCWLLPRVRAQHEVTHASLHGQAGVAQHDIVGSGVAGGLDGIFKLKLDA